MRKLWLAATLGLFAVMVPALTWADTLIMRDGTEHDGQFISGTSRVITFRENGRLVRYNVDDVDSVQFGTAISSGNSSNGNSSSSERNTPRPPDYNAPVSERPRDYNAPVADNSPRYDNAESRTREVIPSGTELVIRTNESVDSRTARPDQTFMAQIDEDVLAPSGDVLIPRGSDARLVIRQMNTGGTTGTPEMTLDVESVTVDGHRYLVDTSDVATKGNSGVGKNKRTGQYVGGGAVLGTIIGAIAGGGRGAAIGAVSGAAAGAGAVVLTKGKDVRVPSETTLRFRLEQPVRLRDAN
jgi:hypothetical protein